MRQETWNKYHLRYSHELFLLPTFNRSSPFSPIFIHWKPSWWPFVQKSEAVDISESPVALFVPKILRPIIPHDFETATQTWGLFKQSFEKTGLNVFTLTNPIRWFMNPRILLMFLLAGTIVKDITDQCNSENSYFWVNCELKIYVGLWRHI